VLTRLLPDGREATIYPLLGGRARLGVGEAGGYSFDDVW
jgi:hypothetical protein